MEGATLSLLAFHPDLSAHQRNQLGTNAKAQSRSTVFSGRGVVGLPERLKYQSLLIFRYADSAVDYPQVQRHDLFPSRLRVDIDDDFAIVCELDGVPHQIQENLPQSTGVSQEGVGQFRADV